MEPRSQEKSLPVEPPSPKLRIHIPSSSEDEEEKSLGLLDSPETGETMNRDQISENRLDDLADDTLVDLKKNKEFGWLLETTESELNQLHVERLFDEVGRDLDGARLIKILAEKREDDLLAARIDELMRIAIDDLKRQREFDESLESLDADLDALIYGNARENILKFLMLHFHKNVFTADMRSDESRPDLDEEFEKLLSMAETDLERSTMEYLP